jgi:hypothetical protein
MGLIAKKHTYDAAASSPAVTVNGTRIRLQLKPEGTSGGNFAVSAMVVGATVATLDGPFRWRFEATSDSRKAEYLVVHRVRTRTSKTGRDEWYPAEHLDKRVDFVKPKDASGPTRAVYELPGLLQVKPREDGELEVMADLAVTGQGRTVRKQVRFRLSPVEGRQDEFVFIPTEIVKSFGRRPEEWSDQGWE